MINLRFLRFICKSGSWLTKAKMSSCLIILGLFICFITGPSNGPVFFCSLASVGVIFHLSSSVTLLVGEPAAGRAGG